VRLARGEADGALADVQRGLEVARAVRDPQAYVPGLSDAIFILAELGRLDEAQELALELRSALDSANAPAWTVYNALHVAGRVGLVEPLREFVRRRTGPASAAMMDSIEGRWAAAATAAEAEGRLPRASRMHLLAAEQLVVEGRRAEADEHVRAALRFYRAVGATFYIERAEALLAAPA
jgi:tetratricopeptide (TPR) repeat protein